MSLRQNVNYIKDEFNNNEKMLEGLIRFEKWFKHYKIPIIVLVAALISWFVVYNIMSYYQEKQQLKIANFYEKALLGDEMAIQSLKQSQSKLYDLYLFQKALSSNDQVILEQLQSSKDLIIAKFSKYQNASLNRNIEVLNLQDSTEFGYLQAAFLEIEKGNFKEAKNILEKIQNNSPTKDIANALEHLTIKGIKE